MEFVDKAKKAEDAGDCLSAINYYLQAFEMLRVENNARKHQFQAGEIFHHLANSYVAIGDLDNAMKYYKDATEQYLVSNEELTTIYHRIGECYSSLGICYLIQLNHKIALKQFDKAIDFFERFIKITEESLKDEGGKYVILNNALTVLCRLNLHVRYDELKPLLHKITKLNKKYDVKGFAVDLSLFFAYLFEGVITEAYGLLRQKLQNAENSSLLRSNLQAAVLGNVMEIAFHYLPQSRMRIGDKVVKEKGEVILTQKIFEDMLLYGFSFANRKMPSEEYKEVIALLVGKIQKENVIISEIVPMTSGTEAEVDGFSDIDTGETTPSEVPPFISANLDSFDAINPSAPDPYYVNVTLVRDYTNSQRETNLLRFEETSVSSEVGEYTRNSDYYFDKNTGVLVEYLFEFSYTGLLSMRYVKLVSSNVWVVPEFPVWIILPLFMIVALSAIAIKRKAFKPTYHNLRCQ